MFYITSDLLEHRPESRITKVAAFLDKKSARQIIIQAALLTRLRSLISKDGDSIGAKISDACMKCRKAGETWEKQPEWWSDDDHCVKLLIKLNELGFANILSATSFVGDSEQVGCLYQFCLFVEVLTLHGNSTLCSLEQVVARARIDEIHCSNQSQHDRSRASCDGRDERDPAVVGRTAHAWSCKKARL